jgi:hypothetical protein
MNYTARILIDTKEPPSRLQIKHLQYELLNRFADGIFDCEQDGEYIDFIEPVERQESDPISTLQVRLASRYYGYGYERGFGFRISGILLYLTQEYPNWIIYYGGNGDSRDDSLVLDPFKQLQDIILSCSEDGPIPFARMTSESSLQLLNHFIKNGSFPYYRKFEEILRTKDIKKEVCPYCENPMLNLGSTSYCVGCRLVYKDAVA